MKSRPLSMMEAMEALDTVLEWRQPATGLSPKAVKAAMNLADFAAVERLYETAVGHFSAEDWLEMEIGKAEAIVSARDGGISE